MAKIDKPIVYLKDGEEMISDKILIAARHENYDVLIFLTLQYSSM
nr:hypothetical protein [uncultured Treponema sp.]